MGILDNYKPQQTAGSVLAPTMGDYVDADQNIQLQPISAEPSPQGLRDYERLQEAVIDADTIRGDYFGLPKGTNVRMQGYNAVEMPGKEYNLDKYAEASTTGGGLTPEAQSALDSRRELVDKIYKAQQGIDVKAGKLATLQTTKHDKYGRLLGDITLSDAGKVTGSVSNEMIKQGGVNAWIDPTSGNEYEQRKLAYSLLDQALVKANQSNSDADWARFEALVNNSGLNTGEKQQWLERDLPVAKTFANAVVGAGEVFSKGGNQVIEWLSKAPQYLFQRYEPGKGWRPDEENKAMYDLFKPVADTIEAAGKAPSSKQIEESFKPIRETLNSTFNTRIFSELEATEVPSVAKAVHDWNKGRTASALTGIASSVMQGIINEETAAMLVPWFGGTALTLGKAKEFKDAGASDEKALVYGTLYSALNKMGLQASLGQVKAIGNAMVGKAVGNAAVELGTENIQSLLELDAAGKIKSLADVAKSVKDTSRETGPSAVFGGMASVASDVSERVRDRLTANQAAVEATLPTQTVAPVETAPVDAISEQPSATTDFDSAFAEADKTFSTNDKAVIHGAVKNLVDVYEKMTPEQQTERLGDLKAALATHKELVVDAIKKGKVDEVVLGAKPDEINSLVDSILYAKDDAEAKLLADALKSKYADNAQLVKDVDDRVAENATIRNMETVANEVALVGMDKDRQGFIEYYQQAKRGNENAKNKLQAFTQKQEAKLSKLDVGIRDLNDEIDGKLGRIVANLTGKEKLVALTNVLKAMAGDESNYKKLDVENKTIDYGTDVEGNSVRFDVNTDYAVAARIRNMVGDELFGKMLKTTKWRNLNAEDAGKTKVEAVRDAVATEIAQMKGLLGRLEGKVEAKPVVETVPEVKATIEAEVPAVNGEATTKEVVPPVVVEKAVTQAKESKKSTSGVKYENLTPAEARWMKNYVNAGKPARGTKKYNRLMEKSKLVKIKKSNIMQVAKADLERQEGVLDEDKVAKAIQTALQIKADETRDDLGLNDEDMAELERRRKEAEVTKEVGPAPKVETRRKVEVKETASEGVKALANELNSVDVSKLGLEDTKKYLKTSLVREAKDGTVLSELRSELKNRLRELQQKEVTKPKVDVQVLEETAQLEEAAEVINADKVAEINTQLAKLVSEKAPKEEINKLKAIRRELLELVRNAKANANYIRKQIAANVKGTDRIATYLRYGSAWAGKLWAETVSTKVGGKEIKMPVNLDKIIEVKKYAGSALGIAQLKDLPLTLAQTKIFASNLKNTIAPWKGSALELVQDPMRLVLFNDKGAMNSNVVAAMMAATMDVIGHKGSSYNELTDSQIEGQYGRSVDEINDEQLAKMRTMGVLKQYVASDIGKATMRNLGLTMAKDGDTEVYEKIYMGLGQAALLAAQKQGLVKIDGIPTNTLREMMALPINESDTEKSYLVKVTSVDAMIRAEQAFDDVNSEIGVETNVPNVRSTLRNVDELELEIRNNPYQKVNAAMTKTVKKAMNAEWTLNMDVVSRLLTMDRDGLKKALGYTEIGEDGKAIGKVLSYGALEGAKGKNLQVERSIAELEKIYNKITSKQQDNKMYFDWFVSKNGRLFIDSVGLNPQTDKQLHRFAMLLKEQVAEIDTNKVDSDEVKMFKFGVAAAFGMGIDKEKTSTVIGFADKLINAPLNELQRGVEDAIAGKKATVNGVSIKVAELSHMVLALSEIEKWQKANGGKFESMMTVETDALTSGLGLKLLQIPITNAVEWLAKAGFITKDKDGQYPRTITNVLGTNDVTQVTEMLKDLGMNDLSALKMLDSYKTLAKRMGTDEELVATLDEANDAVQDELNDVLGSNRLQNFKAFKSLLGAEADVVDAKGDVTKFGRDLFKKPFMTFLYGAGFGKIRKELTGKLQDMWIDNVLTKVSDDELTATFAKMGMKVDGENLKEQLVAMPLSKIMVDGVKLQKMFDVVFGRVYGQSVEKALKSEFQELVEANETINTTFRIMTRVYLKAFDKVTEGKDVLSADEEHRIFEELRVLFPVIQHPLGKADRSDGIGVFDSERLGKENYRYLDATQTILKDGSTTKVHTLRRKLVEAIAAGGVNGIHQLDGAGMTLVMADGSVMGIHDALLLGMGQIGKIKEYNKTIGEVSRNWSLTEALANAVTDIVKLDKTVDGVKINGKALLRELAADKKVTDELGDISKRLNDVVRLANATMENRELIFKNLVSKHMVFDSTTNENIAEVKPKNTIMQYKSATIVVNKQTVVTTVSNGMTYEYNKLEKTVHVSAGNNRVQLTKSQASIIVERLFTAKLSNDLVSALSEKPCK